MSKVNQTDRPIILWVTTIDWHAQAAREYFSTFADKDCHVYVSHQITDPLIQPLDLSQDFVFYLPLQGKGLSKNRNNILSQVQEGIYVVCDEDVKLHEWWKKTILQAYTTSEASCITFQSQAEIGLRKTYKNNQYTHSQISVLWVSSIEITFDVRDIKNNGIMFDEEFGLWTAYPSGEENIFLKDCLDAWLECSYQPYIINHHEIESSWSKIDRHVKKKVFVRMYGNILWSILVCIFRIKILLV